MRYTTDEVRVLVEEYEELRYSEWDFIRVRLMDLTRCLQFLPWHHRHALVLTYALWVNVDWIAEQLNVHPNTVYRWSELALETLTDLMNGATW
jgi:DNA-directed RNA polymerase specialized sigma24 family protein